MAAVKHIEQVSSTSSNGSGAHGDLQDPLHLPLHLSRRQRILEYFKKWGWVVPPKTESGKYSISQPMMLVIIGVLGAAFFTYWWRSEDKLQKQHDDIIRLETLLSVEGKKNEVQESRIDQAMNRAINAEKANVATQASFQQFATLFGIKNASKINFSALPQNGDSQ